MFASAQSAATECVSQARDGISKVLAAKTAITSSYYNHLDSVRDAKSQSASIVHTLEQQPEVAHALFTQEREPKHQSLLAAISQLSRVLTAQEPEDLNDKFGPFTMHAKHSRIIHPVWDFFDWEKPCVALQNDVTDLEATSALRAVNQLVCSDAFLFSACESGTIDVFDLRMRYPVHVQRLAKHDGAVLSLAVDGDCLFSGGVDHSINIWRYGLHLERGTIAEDDVDVDAWELSHTLHGHTGWVRALAFDEPKLRLYSGSGWLPARSCFTANVSLCYRRRDDPRVGRADVGVSIHPPASHQLGAVAALAQRPSLCGLGRQEDIR